MKLIFARILNLILDPLVDRLVERLSDRLTNILIQRLATTVELKLPEDGAAIKRFMQDSRGDVRGVFTVSEPTTEKTQPAK